MYEPSGCATMELWKKKSNLSSLECFGTAISNQPIKCDDTAIHSTHMRGCEYMEKKQLLQNLNNENTALYIWFFSFQFSVKIHIFFERQAYKLCNIRYLHAQNVIFCCTQHRTPSLYMVCRMHFHLKKKKIRT